ncbi:hypothetical protein M0805_001248 [Coniferiporia weirii]|nr:hypothetical protein M0805_001248 [Coniferiporia weirii]
MTTQDLPPLPLPEGVSSKYIPVNDLIVHFLEALPQPEAVQTSGEKLPLLILLHGFPELAYSWRDMLRPLADLGYRVVAPDQRGYGRTTPISSSSADPYPYTYSSPLVQFSLTSLTRDIVAFTTALGHTHAACVIGHDFGSAIAAVCALTRPDVFRSVVLMGAPFPGALGVPSSVPTFASLGDALAAPEARAISGTRAIGVGLDALFASMDPPHMHYQHYFSLPQANALMHTNLSQAELHTFLRSYFHIKSACWSGATKPGVLSGWTKDEAARLPPYYLMPRGRSMPDVVNAYHPQGTELERSRAWLSEDDLAVYVQEYRRTGFHGGLNRYRCVTGLGRAYDTLESISPSAEDHMASLSLFAGKKIEVPALFIAGAMDWCALQSPGALQKMRVECPLMKAGDEGIVFIENAGHWVQQERPHDTLLVFKTFLQSLNK